MRSGRARLKDYCYLCGDIRQDPRSSGIAMHYGPEALRRAVLWKEADLYLTPAPGTIAVGYLILATSVHISRFAEVPADCLKRVEAIWRRVSRAGRDRGVETYIMYEHGGQSLRNRGAACVDHAHLHLVPSPNPNQVRTILSDRFQEHPLSSPCELASLATAPPYIALFGPDFGCYYIMREVESQLVRRILAWQWGIPTKWNWRHHSLAPNFNRTLALFQDGFAP